MTQFWRLTGPVALIILAVTLWSSALPVKAAEQTLLDWLAQQQTQRPAATAITSEPDLLNKLNANATHPLMQISDILKARHQLTPAQQLTIMPTLKAQMDANGSNAYRWMTYGFAQVVLERNKTGLFFLRKANDQLQTSTTALAYAIAQADVERSVENVDPAEVTPRKLDVAYLLHQAVEQDAKAHEPGFWPLFADTVSQLRTWGGYSDQLTRDYSEAYVPLGNRMVKYVAPSTVEQYLATRGIVAPPPKPQAGGRASQSTVGQSTLKPVKIASDKPRFRFFWQKEKPVVTATAPIPLDTVATAPEVSANEGTAYVAVPVASASPVLSPTVVTQQQQGTLIETRHLQMTPDPTQWITVQYSTLTPQQPVTAYPLQATVLTKNNQSLGRITVPNKLSLAEDLDRDGIFELVVRQYSLVPYFPVRVFHITPQGLVEDPAVTQLFQ